ncbi:MAG: hypothetical protein GXP56_07145 [Deltaproteobacteria bacterium]|nr:hypothetical protein [Deltaproteobacteria bacterium]
MACNYKKGRFVFFIISALLIFTFNNAFANPLKKLFIIHSYEKDHICGQPQHDGAMKAISESGWEVGKNLDVSVYYMDTKKKNNTPELIEQQAKKAQKKIKKFKPDIILTLDDNAFRTVALPLAGTKTSIVFSGINEQPENYNKIKHFMETRKNPGSNITGIYEKLHVREAIKILSNMLELKKVLVLNDLSPTGKAISGQVKLELFSDRNKKGLPCEVELKTIKSWEEYKDIINIINSSPAIDAFYLGVLLLKDAAGNTHTAPDIIKYTIKHAKKPAMGPNYAFIKMGLYGGASVDFFAMGYQAGQKVAAILNGADPGELPIQDARRIALVFNLSRADALGIKIPDDILLAADEVFKK